MEASRRDAIEDMKYRHPHAKVTLLERYEEDGSTRLASIMPDGSTEAALGEPPMTGEIFVNPENGKRHFFNAGIWHTVSEKQAKPKRDRNGAIVRDVFGAPVME